jgi:hypothetical protein
VFSVFALAAPASAALDSGDNAPDWKMTFGTFLIGHSNFDEISLSGQNMDKHVWGGINSVLLDATIEKYAGNNIFVNLAYRRTPIKTSSMYTNFNHPVYGAILLQNNMYGYSDFIDMNALYRLVRTENMYMDFGVGYGYSWTDKNFTGRVSSNPNYPTNQAGTYAVYELEFYGPKLNYRFRWMPATIGLEGKLEGSTLMRNNIRYVTANPSGYCTSANGSYYKGDIKAVWVPKSHGFDRNWEFGFGYQKGGFFFDRMNDTSMDLNIKFEGFFFDVAYRFGTCKK